MNLKDYTQYSIILLHFMLPVCELKQTLTDF